MDDWYKCSLSKLNRIIEELFYKEMISWLNNNIKQDRNDNYRLTKSNKELGIPIWIENSSIRFQLQIFRTIFFKHESDAMVFKLRFGL